MDVGERAVRKTRKFTLTISRIARTYIEILETILVAILIILTLLSLGILFRDMVSVRMDSPLSEIQIVISDVLVVVILVELTRSFIISSVGGERYLEGFIEMGVIILIREVAVAAIEKNIMNAFMASLGVTLLIAALWIAREKIRAVYRERT